MSNSIIDDIKFSFKSGNNITRLIIANVSIFVLFGLLRIFDSLFKLDGALNLYDWFTCPSSLLMLAQKPWSIITYMFLHRDFFHLLSNMIMLYFGGRIFTDMLGNQRVTALYFAGGIAGALVYILLYNTVPLFSNSGIVANMLGASASVLAIFFAIAYYLPNYEVSLILIGAVRLKYIALFLFLLDLLSIDQSNPGGHIAHIGGALFGMFYAFGLKKGYDFTKKTNSFFEQIPQIFKRKKQSYNPKMKVTYSSPKTGTNAGEKKTAGKQEAIDAILDKISKSGYDSLSQKEKDTIFKMSKDD